MNNPKKHGWLNTTNIYLFLLCKLLLAFAMLLLTQVVFYAANTRIFHVDGFGEWMGILWGNLVYGTATLGAMLLPYLAANLLPFNFRWNKIFRGMTELLLYLLPVSYLLIANCIDAAYYQFTYRRITGEIFRYLGIGGQMGSLVPHFIVDYWYATIGVIVSVAILVIVSRRITLQPRNRYRKHGLNDLVGFLVGGLFAVLLLRIGLGEQFVSREPAQYCQAKNSAMVTNSGYNLVNTFNGGTLREAPFMSKSKARALFDPEFSPNSVLRDHAGNHAEGWAPYAGRYHRQTVDSLGTHTDTARTYNNVVVIILESFSQEYMGCYNQGIMPSYTPFLDSLARHCVVYQGRANGKKSIEGIPAIFSSMPTLMSFPLPMSDYTGNDLYALPSILHDNGFHTAFFHGSYNGVMSFDRVCAHLGFDEYYGKDEYMAEPGAKESDYDGCWGIFDEPYLQYMVHKISTFKEPFFVGEFTLSSHHPYKMAPGHENDFAEGPHPLCRVVTYSDNALRKFFDAARQTDWYDHTLFVITADHSGQGLHREYNDYDGWYRIPMLFYMPHYEESAPIVADTNYYSTHYVSPRLMQQTDIMPTLLDYLGIETHTVCFGSSAFRNPNNGWQISYGNGYHQLVTQDGNVAVLCKKHEEGNGNIEMLKAIVQQYNHRFIHNLLKP